MAGAGLEQMALDALLAKLESDGLLKAGGKQRADSTHVVAAVAALNRLELAGESVRAAVEALAAAHPARLVAVAAGAGDGAAAGGEPARPGGGRGGADPDRLAVPAGAAPGRPWL